MKLVTFLSWDQKYPTETTSQGTLISLCQEGKAELMVQEHAGELPNILVDQDAETLSRTQRWGGGELGQWRNWKVGRWGIGYNLPTPTLSDVRIPGRLSVLL